MRRGSSWLGAVVIVATVFALGPRAPRRSWPPEARTRGASPGKPRGRFGMGRYGEAAEKYEAAFALRPDPALLYNAAQSHRLAGNKPRALELYRNYVRLYPDGASAEDARGHVSALKKASRTSRAHNRPARRRRPPAPAPPAAGDAARRPSRQRRRDAAAARDDDAAFAADQHERAALDPSRARAGRGEAVAHRADVVLGRGRSGRRGGRYDGDLARVARRDVPRADVRDRARQLGCWCDRHRDSRSLSVCSRPSRRDWGWGAARATSSRAAGQERCSCTSISGRSAAV